MDPQILVDAFRDAKLIGKDETLRLVERASRVGDGWAITVDLPATRKATDVIKNREALASALAVDEVQLLVERVRGNGGHAGRIAMWVADTDPYATPPMRTPLLEAPGERIEDEPGGGQPGGEGLALPGDRTDQQRGPHQRKTDTAVPGVAAEGHRSPGRGRWVVASDTDDDCDDRDDVSDRPRGRPQRKDALRAQARESRTSARN